ncbi:hypothetical protein QOZ80_5BG0419010 [Eleusine coracana subsp. coracana]|nr:hypothetical protein QOZ80_5BG0419010 [Eleusine coracana subsp. coracana]
MASVSALLPALCKKIRGVAEPGTDMELRRVSMACIFVAMHNLGHARKTTNKRRKSITPVSTSQFLDNEYPLGTGISSKVSEVQHRTSGKTFAMKRLDEQDDDVGEEEDDVCFNLRVLRQACFMAACRGRPSLVRLHAVCIDPADTDRYCLLMENLGLSLHKVLSCMRHYKPFLEHEVRHMMRQILSGAKAMHELGIVHRGINSKNVLVAAIGYIVKIGGFGQATCTSETDVPFLNEVWEEAPELLLQGRGANESELLDSWSIGCLMAELLTGSALFVVKNRENTKEAQFHRLLDVLGVPGKKTMQEMKPRNLELANEVREWRARRPRVGKKKPHNNNYRLRKLVPPEVLSDDGFEVLQGLVTFNPKKRLTAADALQLPWFSDNNGDKTDNSPAAEVSQQVSRPVSRPCPFTCWLLLIGLLLLCLVVFVCIGSR